MAQIFAFICTSFRIRVCVLQFQIQDIYVCCVSGSIDSTGISDSLVPRLPNLFNVATLNILFAQYYTCNSHTLGCICGLSIGKLLCTGTGPGNVVIIYQMFTHQ